jgi:hypothetical protein
MINIYVSIIFRIMEKVIVLSILITCMYGLVKFGEMKIIDKQMKPLKTFVRDMVCVFISSVFINMIYFYFDNSITELFNVVTNSRNMNNLATPQIFTDSPGF